MAAAKSSAAKAAAPDFDEEPESGATETDPAPEAERTPKRQRIVTDFHRAAVADREIAELKARLKRHEAKAEEAQMQLETLIKGLSKEVTALLVTKQGQEKT